MLRRRLGEDGFAAAWTDGEELPIEAVVERAAAGCRIGAAGEAEAAAAAGEAGAAAAAGEAAPHVPGGQGADPAGGAPAGLTDREVEVLRLLGRGLSNREIGQALFISPGTVGAHVSNILRKLGVSRRVQAAGIAHRFGLD
jgi:DNA-binding NarL/FixJ family response regulator